MKKNPQHASVAGNKTRIEQAEARTEQAETRTEQARSRTELAETRTEQAETRTELAKNRTEQAEIRTEQAETRSEQAEMALQRSVHNEIELSKKLSTRLFKRLPRKGIADQKSLLEQLTRRQREILKLIADGHNTKQTANILNLSPKTVDYHRMKLMDGLNIHDIAGLVRFALRVGLIPQEK
jgi:DNA-binding CsgD family transcriptional regulator